MTYRECSDHPANRYRVGVVFKKFLGSLMTATLCCYRCFVIYTAYDWTSFAVYVMLWVIIITRLYAMYQRSRKILIFLVVSFLAVNIFDGVAAIMSTMHTSGEELVLSGTYQCSTNYAGDMLLLASLSWILATVWEVLALCLAVWIAVKHFRELRRHSAGGIIGDCFTVLMKTHMLYFASFVGLPFLHPFHYLFLSDTQNRSIFPRYPDLLRPVFDFGGRADVCARTTPDP
ncbi:hypothetical protein BDR07DRAFT_922967 [Suillus spraguei]|nr:hypothetical protein BDR07DRAFT_922967 [Suillus spraguei]